MLDDQETFRRLKAEYGCSQPEDAIVASIESNRQRILTSMRPRLVELGRLKGVLAREDRIREEKAIVARRYWELLTESLYGNTPFIQNSGDIYLHQSAGVVVTVREGEKIESHAIRTDGFDVLMGERRIVGSIPSERFETQEQASQMLAETQIRYLFGYSYLHVDPVLHVGGYLVEAKWDRKKGNVAEVVGVIEKIDAANVARQMAQGLEGKSPRAVSETGPKTRRLR
jgi:hypothetical protein